VPRDHEQLEVFKLADMLVVQAYELSASFPRSEAFGLTSQVRRAAISAVTNIVEGCSRDSPREFAHFLDISTGSTAEARYLLRLASRLGLLPASRLQGYDDQADKLLRSLNRFCKRLRPR
jgi:four helix bundle protein